jgi:hypothetical protein
MKRLISLVLVMLASSFLVVAMPAAANAKATPVICPANDSGKIDTSDDPQSVTVTAPEGFLIGGYCVKGGLVTDEVTLETPQESVTISVSNGKAVSHYSVWYVEDECSYYECGGGGGS